MYLTGAFLIDSVIIIETVGGRGRGGGNFLGDVIMLRRGPKWGFEQPFLKANKLRSVRGLFNNFLFVCTRIIRR